MQLNTVALVAITLQLVEAQAHQAKEFKLCGERKQGLKDSVYICFMAFRKAPTAGMKMHCADQIVVTCYTPQTDLLCS